MMPIKLLKLKHPVVDIIIRPSFENEEDIFHSNRCILRGWKPVIFLGRCLGTISRSDILDIDKGQGRTHHHRKINPASILSSVMCLYLLANAILLMRHNFKKFEQDKTTLVKLEGFNHVAYSVSMFSIYSYQLFASQKLRNILRWLFASNRASKLPGFVARHGISSYPTFSWLVLGICFFLGVAENAVFDWQSLRRGVVGKTKTVSILELYYRENFKHWHVVLSEYNPPLTLLMAIFTKLATWGWVYMDVVCVLLCRALWEKLWIIAEQLHWNPFKSKQPSKEDGVSTVLGAFSKTDLDHRQQHSVYKEEYVMITNLVEQVQNYISPMIAVCYVANMYILIVMMFNWIGPFSTEGVSSEKTIHVCFAFFQFLFRVYIIFYFAGEVHQMCLEIRRQIQMCPNSMYTISLERLERILIAHPTGICLFGSFMITRKFFVSIVSFIFTTEIVLLQSYSGYYTVHNSTLKN